MPSYKKRIPVTELLEHPEACLIRDVLSQTGSTVLIPGGIPISKFVEGLDDPNRVVEALIRVGIQTVDVVLPDKFDVEEAMAQLSEVDPTAKVLDEEVAEQAQVVMGNIFEKMSVDEKYSIPKDEVDNLGHTLAKALDSVSQIALSLFSGEERSYAQTHALNVSMLAGHITKKLVEAGLVKPELTEKAIVAGLLFDIGKTVIPKAILEKRDPLSEDERNIIKTHVHESVRMCREMGVTDVDILDGIATHHEKYDGSGYLKGLVGTRIPIIGRILAVADTFDAMTSQRAHKDAISSKLSFNFIMSANETHFDPDICKVFISGMGIYPPGSIVELSNGVVGTVMAMTQGNLLQPKVVIKKDGESTIVDLAANKLFIKRSLDADPRDELDLGTL